MVSTQGEGVFRQLVENVRGYIYSVQYSDDEVKAVYHSPQCEAITGYAPEKFEADSDLWSKMVHPDDLARVLKLFSEHDENTTEKTVYHRIIKKDGEVRWILNRCVVYKNHKSKAMHVQGMITDITELKQTEHELCEAKKKAEAVAAIMDDYVALVSHDLRSPLTTISGFLGLLEKQIDKSVESNLLREIITRVQAITENQTEMIGRLLNVSLIHSGNMKLQIETVAARDIVATQLTIASLHAERKGVVIRNETPAGRFVNVDEVLFGQVIQNLLINAVKFCNEGDSVTVSMPQEEVDVIVVRDNGIGISPSDLSNLFNRKGKTPSLGTANEKGTGLGLPYCYKIMKDHGGDIWVESQPGEGSAFFCMIPFGPP